MVKKYKSIETWENAMRKDKQKKLWADWFFIGGHWYTCEEYDESGKYMRYTSVTARKHVDLDTSNRYSKNWLSDLKTTVYPIDYLRFDISYYIAEPKKLDKKTVLLLNIWLWDNKIYEQIRNLCDLLAYNLK